MIIYFFAAASSTVGIACFVPYLRDIFKRKTQPHSYTWLVWAILQTTGVVAMLAAGAGIGIASLAIGAVLCGFIFLLSLRYGTRDIKIFDTVCLVAALGVLGIYIFLRDPLFSIIAVTTIDFIGFMPTFRKAYVNPHSETSSNYALSALSSFLALGALQVVSVTTALYLVSLVITNGACAAIILTRRKKTGFPLDEKQRKYLETISDSALVVIQPWDSKTEPVAKKLMDDMRPAVPDLEVFHTGAAALNISGKNDLDFSILGVPEDFDNYLPALIKVLGEPQKRGRENVRWEIIRDGFPVDVHLTDKDSLGWKEHKKIFELLRDNSQILEEYQILKEQSNGVSLREYQRRKYEFYNRILAGNINLER
jgi:GrpB-like predicted nucleotidyltransferase (UPF0157 family)